MNVYDFDGTIYSGDSTADFYKHCLKKYPRIWKTIPRMVFAFGMYALGIYKKTKFKEIMYRFLTCVPDISAEVEIFWDLHMKNIKRYYKEQHSEDDMVISASPEFLLKPVCDRLGITRLIASRVDPHTGKYDGLNCRDTEKVRRLNEYAPNAEIDEFYSDSLADVPLAELSERAYMVRGETVTPWDEYKPTLFEKAKRMFFNREFIMFVVVGVINTLSNVIFSTIYSLFIPNTTLAFFPGYITSNVVSYLLNSALTFKEKLGFVKFVKFFISYIPNFLIQTVIVFLFDRFIHGPSIVAYAVAAVIGVPVTFVFMKIFTFKSKDNGSA